MFNRGRDRLLSLIIEALIILSSMLWAISGLQTVFLGDSLTSRLATVYALTYHHTWYLNRPPALPPNPFENKTVDKVQGKLGIISSKPPILSLLMTLEYQIIKRAGYSLDNQQHLKPIAQILIFINVIIPFFLASVCFWKFLYEIKTGTLIRMCSLLSLLFGTQWSALSSHFTNHVPATAFLIMGIYFVWKVYNYSNVPKYYLLLVGFFASLVYTIDLPLTIYIASGILFLLYKKPPRLLIPITIGAMPILLVHFIIMYSITGNILPVQISHEPFLFESSYWRHPAGPDALHHPKWLYAFNILIGAKGIFLLYPVLIFGLCTCYPSIWKHISNDIKVAWLFFIFSFIIINLYYILSTNNYGGVSYGFRWHVGSMPILIGASLPFLEGKKKNAVFWCIYLVFLVVSFYSMYECRCCPWSIDKEWTVRWIFGPLS
ncbi:MAG: hypothetical protein LDL53_07710 [Candidatus Hydrogenedens sp.]|nr:hypothetical protein [Candidatus Hydrogenedens sp.]